MVFYKWKIDFYNNQSIWCQLNILILRINKVSWRITLSSLASYLITSNKMADDKQFIKWARFYIFGVSILQLLFSLSYLIEPESILSYFPDWMMWFNLIISFGGLLALRRSEIQYYVTTIGLRLIIDLPIRCSAHSRLTRGNDVPTNT